MTIILMHNKPLIMRQFGDFITGAGQVTDLRITLFILKEKARGCLGGRARAVTEPLRIHRDIHIFQYVETVNAPDEGAGRRGPVVPLGAVFLLRVLLCRGLSQVF